jgi:hypothetical protein
MQLDHVHDWASSQQQVRIQTALDKQNNLPQNGNRTFIFCLVTAILAIAAATASFLLSFSFGSTTGSLFLSKSLQQISYL